MTGDPFNRLTDTQKIAALRARIGALEYALELSGAMAAHPRCPTCGEFLCRRTTFKGQPAYCEPCGRDVPQPPADTRVTGYEDAAEWYAGRELTGAASEPAPPDVAADVQADIDGDRDAFMARVRDYAYARSMNRLNLPEDPTDE